ncbi:hypothetical protein B0T19DRAFT_437807 [Cercophora scortea]|uniref:6-phosphogluconate dehydrogenase n=1 Tax=Cercophora scortea TaxID=314031 RepID=A0AAE0J6I3_9PEZI|nr:hypothetical protein B0T19DRAFT_437807 [Cercophora scortea]
MATTTTATDASPETGDAAPPQPRATIGIISLGDMGSGLAKLLVAHGYTVATNVFGRSQDTLIRAVRADVQLLQSDVELIEACDVILSVVPPRDALATAQRIADAAILSTRTTPVYFVDLNAVSPATCRTIAALFPSRLPSSSSSPDADDADTDGIVRFIDGSILGGPPSKTNKPPSSPSTTTTTAPTIANETWTRPLLPTSGPYSLSHIPPYGPHLATTLHTKHISPTIGAASGLKMCFASLSKGYAAIALQAATTAHALGVLPDLRSALSELFPKGGLERMERAVVGAPPKAYRWVREMEEIAATHADEGGLGAGLFLGAADMFRFVAEETVLGEEKVGKRVRGTTVEDVAAAIGEGVERKRRRMGTGKGARGS